MKCYIGIATIAILPELLLVACVTASSIDSKNGKSFSVHNRSYSEVWNAAIKTITSIGAIDSHDRNHGEVRGFKEASAFSWGEAIAIFIEPANENVKNFTVTVVSEHTLQGQVTGRNYEETMITAMKAYLNIDY